ncbi:hypothetical protein SteCoe_35936 [Stentor coeruleus]|uniref:RING-type domain-containing protein n=1 Tax=Stentor coeruleus TaxID=5963 RepID=A0A1R2AR76_9CILI|nr:hypothetical protein SteCoe_35936 [Stentor coeruleus]
MLAILTIVSLCLAKVSIVSPDELADESIPYIITTFSNIRLYPIYGKLEFIRIDSSCEFSSKQKSLMKQTVIPVVLNVDSFGCSYDVVSLASEKNGSPGTIIVSDSTSYYKNFYSYDLVMKNPEEYVFSANSVCIIITSKTLKVFDNYLDKQIWITYSYTEFFVTKFPSTTFYMSSNFDYDYQFYKFFYEVVFERYVFKNELKFTFTYIDYDYFKYPTEENCYYSAGSDVYYCLPPSNNSTGIEMVLNSILSLNAYSTFYNKDANLFFEYMKKLMTKCINNRSVKCHEEVLLDYNIEPNYDDSVITQGFKDDEILARAAINEIYIYDFKYISDLYIFCSNYETVIGSMYTDGCTYKNLTDNSCKAECNNAKCAYDFLTCLKIDECYSFIIDDGNCNRLCPGESDCHESDNQNLLLVKILVPIFGFILIAGIVAGIIAIYVIKRRRKEAKNEEIEKENVTKPTIINNGLKNQECEKVPLAVVDYDIKNSRKIGKFTFITFRPNLIYTGDPLCTIDAMAIEDGQEIALLNECQHIYHAQCIKRWLTDKNTNEKCLNCNSNREKHRQVDNQI